LTSPLVPLLIKERETGIFFSLLRRGRSNIPLTFTRRRARGEVILKRVVFSLLYILMALNYLCTDIPYLRALNYLR
jgi:hypothetical protein